MSNRRKSIRRPIFPREDWLEIIRILHAARVQSGNGQNLDLELLLNQLGGIYKPEVDDLEADSPLQAALSAQASKMSYETEEQPYKTVLDQGRTMKQDLQSLPLPKL
jgi:hypothetical protein